MKYIGIDVGGTNLKAGLVDENGTILAVERTPLGKVPGAEAFAPSAFCLESVERLPGDGLHLKYIPQRKTL